MSRYFFRRLHILAALVLASGAAAAPPITVQGSIKNSGGAPLTGSHAMVFRIYDSASGGTQLWTESQPSVSFTNGIYSAVLGNSTSLDGIFGDGLDRWLGVTLDGGTEFSPRQQLSATPYSFYSSQTKTASALDGATSAAFALAGHTHPKSYVFVGTSNGGSVFNVSYIPISGGDSISNETRTQAPAPANMIFTKLRLQCNSLPIQSASLTLRVNGTNTSLVTTVLSPATASSAIASVAVNEGDLISLLYSGPNMSNGISFSLTGEAP